MDLPVSLSDSPEIVLRAIENKLKCLEESAHALKVYRNTLIPISNLPPEILCIIFSLLEVLDLESSPPNSASLVSHVCHRWRQISLNLPHLWSHINFTNLTTAGTAVMLVRAKTAPLHIKARTMGWSTSKLEAFKEQIEAHIHHIRHLSITANRECLAMFGQLSAAPSLELLSIGDREFPGPVLPVEIPDNLFDGIAPKLTYLRLYNCGISWRSPLLEGLRYLELFSFPLSSQVPFYRWLGALKQMPQLERLVLDDGVPCKLVELSQGLMFTVDLPSLTELSISASVNDCAVVLAHLVLPALTRLRVIAQINPSVFRPPEVAEHLIQCVTQNAHGPQDAEALQSLFIGGNKTRADIAAWTMPRQDSGDGLRSSIDLPDGTRPARLEFGIRILYSHGMDIQLYNAVLAALPLNSIASLTVEGLPPLSKEDWRSHASRWHKLERVRLFNDAVPAFRAMFEDAAEPGDPLLPSLDELILVDISLNAQKVYYLCDMLIECVELGIPLRTLDLRTCTATNRAVQLLSEIVVDVRGPVKNESGDPNGRRRGSAGVLGEEGGRGEEEDGVDVVTSFLGSWDDDHDIEDDL
jgi:hypothetical protein